jgi:hypothetical protein
LKNYEEVKKSMESSTRNMGIVAVILLAIFIVVSRLPPEVRRPALSAQTAGIAVGAVILISAAVIMMSKKP